MRGSTKGEWRVSNISGTSRNEDVHLQSIGRCLDEDVQIVLRNVRYSQNVRNPVRYLIFIFTIAMIANVKTGLSYVHINPIVLSFIRWRCLYLEKTSPILGGLPLPFLHKWTFLDIITLGVTYFMFCSIFKLEKKKPFHTGCVERISLCLLVERKVRGSFYMVHMYEDYSHRDYSPENYIFLEQKLKIQ